MNDKICHVKRLDNLSRLVIPKDICNAAQLKQDDLVKISWNDEDKIISIYKCNDNILENVISQTLKILYRTIECEVIITDKTRIIEVLCSSKNRELLELKNNLISSDLSKMILSNKYQFKEVEEINITNSLKINQQCYYFSVSDNQFILGSVILIAKNKLNSDLLNYVKNQLIR